MKRLAFGPRYCPNCTVIIKDKFDSTYQGYSENPVYLVKRINSKNNDWFYGCPNFPKCKYTEARPLTSEELSIKTRAWANSLYGPHPTY